jgi:hypothetical protein
MKDGLRSVVTVPHHAGHDLVMTVVGEPEVVRAIAAELLGDAAAAAGPMLAELETTPPGSIVHTKPAGVAAGEQPLQYVKTRFATHPGDACWRAQTRSGPVETTSSLLARLRVQWGPLGDAPPAAES